MNSGFKSFPKKLYGNTVKMLNITARAFGMSKPTEIFYSVKDGNWQDITVWETVSGRVGRIPSANDDVYIKHSVNIDTIINPLTSRITVCNNLFVSSSATFQCTTAFGSRFFQVGGDLKSKGTISWTGSGVNSLCLLGYNNEVDATKFNIGVSTVEYGGQSFEKPQYILNLPYAGLTIASYLRTGSPAKLAMGNLNLTTLSIGQYSSMDTLSFNLSVSGTTSIGGGLLYSTGNGSHLFVGLFSCPASGGCIFTGNPILEFRGGFSQTGNPVLPFNFGTGAMSLTTASQDWFSNQAFITFENPITIVGALAMSFRCLTINSTTNVWQFNNVITGDNASSSFLNKGNVWFGTTTAFSGFMTIGTHDFTTLSNVVGYVFNGTATLPYLTYQGLYIAGTGIKTQATGTNTIGTTLTIASGATLTSGGNTTVGTTTTSAGTLNLVTYDWTFTGAVSLTGGQTFAKSGTGAIIFGSTVTMVDGGLAQNFNLSGNPTVEVRNNFQLQAVGTFSSGTGTWTFSTNSSTFNVRYFTYLWTAPILISGAITVTLTNAAGSGGLSTNNSIDGNNALSVLDNRAKLYVSNATYPTPMVTFGTFITNVTAAARIGYIFDGNFTLPLTSYKELYIGGTGIKTLSGNTTCTLFNDPTTIYGNTGGTLECSTFDFTNTGATNIWNVSFKKSGAGNILFTGIVTARNNVAGGIDLSGGNPTIEFRGGITYASSGSIDGWNFGTGLMTFSTNNQSYIPISTQTSNILISGAITVTASNILTISGTINGDNALSTFDNRGTLIYKSATRPMVTGVLQTNAAANTWIYGLNNQDITGGTYRILTLNGTGVKTLQGNVIVATTYTLTAPATLNLNGFTRT